VKQFRFRALVTFDAVAPDRPVRQYPSGTHALMVHIQRSASAGSDIFFPAVITQDDDKPLRPGVRTVVTITLPSDATAASLGAGQHFTLWGGSDIGHGIITRQVYTAFGPS
jgi:hypothetical protein